MTNITISAKLNNITFSQPVPAGAMATFGYAVEKFVVLEDCEPFKKGQTVTVVGENLPVAKISYNISGQLINSKKYGLQIKANMLEELPTETSEGVLALLTSCIKGVGQKTAQAIVDTFGPDTLAIIEKEPIRLAEVKGISAKKADAIHEAYLEHKGVAEIVKILAPLGFSNNKINKIFDKYQEKTMDIIKKTPFDLCKIPGIGFEIVDNLAESFDYPKDANDRIEAALFAAVKSNEANGNVYADAEYIKARAFDMLGCEAITSDKMTEILVKMDETKRVKIIVSRKTGKMVVYSASAAYAEIFAAKKLANLTKSNASTHVSDKSIEEWEYNTGIALSDEQKNAVETSLESAVSVITGGPGTGKTTIIRCIADQLVDMGKNIVMLAPTGCAARRITSSTGYKAYTIHSVLGLKPTEDGTTTATSIVLDVDAVIVDESSMIDMFLAETLIGAVKPGAQLILIGDANQLPSVGPGSVLSEIIESGVVNVSRLTKIYRTKGNGLIAENASKICAGDTSLSFDKESFVFVEANNDSEAAAKMKALYLNEIMLRGDEDVAMLSPFRDKSEACVTKLNEGVHDFANGSSEYKTEVKIGNRTFRVCDLVMQTKNTEEASNGEIGKIVKIDKENKKFVVCFYNKEVEYPFSAFEMFELAYSLSVHKSQGSEYDVVIIDLLNMHKAMLARNLVYTGITRAKKKVIIVGQMEALNKAILNNNYAKRNTFFAARLKKEVAAA